MLNIIGYSFIMSFTGLVIGYYLYKSITKLIELKNYPDDEDEYWGGYFSSSFFFANNSYTNMKQ